MRIDDTGGSDMQPQTNIQSSAKKAVNLTANANLIATPATSHSKQRWKNVCAVCVPCRKYIIE